MNIQSSSTHCPNLQSVLNENTDELSEPPTPEERRPFGLCAGEFSVPDDFNEPLPEEILSTFYPD